MDKGQLIKLKRNSLGLSQKQMAMLLQLNETGERTVRGWENNEHEPSDEVLIKLENLKMDFPYSRKEFHNGLKIIDLFAGIGGMRLAFQNQNCHCVFSSEFDKYCQKTYYANFGEYPEGDINDFTPAKDKIPDHDILLAGFPCQAFSQAGLKKGFEDTRGTLFYEIQRILVAKRPRMFLLENVKQLKGNDRGKTLKIIMNILRGLDQDIDPSIEMSKEARMALGKKLNYYCDFKILRSRDFGLPQNRERLYIVGFDKNFYKGKIKKTKLLEDEDEIFSMFKWPTPLKGIRTSVQQILEDNKKIDSKFTISQKLLDGHIRRKEEHREKGNGFGFSEFDNTDSYTNTISARYYKDGSEILIKQKNKRPRKLTPRECARLQGYPEDFIIDQVSDNQIYKQFGNSVSVPVVEEIAKSMLHFDHTYNLIF